VKKSSRYRKAEQSKCWRAVESKEVDTGTGLGVLLYLVLVVRKRGGRVGEWMDEPK
jgi:hypothetical protein